VCRGGGIGAIYARTIAEWIIAATLEVNFKLGKTDEDSAAAPTYTNDIHHMSMPSHLIQTSFHPNATMPIQATAFTGGGVGVIMPIQATAYTAMQPGATVIMFVGVQGVDEVAAYVASGHLGGIAINQWWSRYSWRTPKPSNSKGSSTSSSSDSAGNGTVPTAPSLPVAGSATAAAAATAAATVEEGQKGATFNRHLRLRLASSGLRC
jgi:hypothetical protein